MEWGDVPCTGSDSAVAAWPPRCCRELRRMPRMGVVLGGKRGKNWHPRRPRAILDDAA